MLDEEETPRRGNTKALRERESARAMRVHEDMQAVSDTDTTRSLEARTHFSMDSPKKLDGAS